MEGILIDNAENAQLTVVTIDGPAGSGKSTTAAKLAKKLRFVNLGSGALYRALAKKALAEGIPFENRARLLSALAEIEFLHQINPEGETVFLVDGVALDRELRTAEISQGASVISLIPEVREGINRVQRKVASRSPVVVEGRDAGTIVFPDAPFKFFLDASVEVRARRQFSEFFPEAESSPERLRAVIEEIRLRDRRDSERSVAPLRVATGARVIDTSSMSVESVVECLYQIVRAG